MYSLDNRGARAYGRRAYIDGTRYIDAPPRVRVKAGLLSVRPPARSLTPIDPLAKGVEVEGSH